MAITEKRLKLKIRSDMMAGIRQFNLITTGDHILIGLSGGKDSLALLDFLGDAKNRAGSKFKISAAHIRMENIDYATDTKYLEKKAMQVGIPLYIRTGKFETDRNPKRTPSFLCAWNRRKILFNLAQEIGCNKIALGHHQDDILHTALMNLTFSGSFSTMPACLEMEKFPITIIRPLCRVKEEDLKIWAEIQDYQPLKKICPYDKTSNRTTIKKVFHELEEVNPEFRYSLWHALEKQNALTETKFSEKV